MGFRKGKTTAIVFILLFLGYYQRWLYIPIYEAISGHLSVDPAAVPSLIENTNNVHNINARGQLQLGQFGNKGKVQEGQRSLEPDIQIQSNKKLDPRLQLGADKMSLSLQRHLEISQRGQNLNLMVRGCKGPKVICGAPIDCSLGCQVHHVITCLMIAYATNRTLIIKWDNWPYSRSGTAWSDIFLPIGVTECPIDNDTTTVIWTRQGLDLSYPEMTTYPYKSGLPIPVNIGESLRKLPTNHFIWWLGQFAKFTLRLQLSQGELMNKLKTALKFDLPTVGILVRKRDKLSEKKMKSSQSMSIDRYMTAARKYFSKLEQVLPDVTRRVFIATDDKNVVKLIRKRYRPPKWEILGFQLKADAEDLVKDIYMLSECDYVICSYSSDICRLVLELKESKSLNATERVKSIDQKYFYASPGFKRLQFLA